MKRVLSISLGSSKRDHKVETKILGEDFIIERRGTDGDKKRAAQLFTELDGQYDAFGIGGIDLYIYAAGSRYVFRDARKLIKNVNKTPAVDGSGLKDTLERKVINYLHKEKKMQFTDKKILMVSAVDRFGMAETFFELGSDVTIGDLIFGLGLPFPIKSMNTLGIIARIVAPIITKLPFELLYPTGDKQDKINAGNKFKKFYDDVDIIAGDFHFIKKYLPQKIEGKYIITNTVTTADIDDLRQRGVSKLITTTPELNGRSFGTNVMEGILVVLAGKNPEKLTSSDYMQLLNKINFVPRIINFKL